MACLLSRSRDNTREGLQQPPYTRPLSMLLKARVNGPSSYNPELAERKARRCDISGPRTFRRGREGYMGES